MAVPMQFHATTFHLVLEKFKATLTDKERRTFQIATLSDLRVAIATIQQKQASQRRLQGMGRLEVFLEGMKEYDKVIQVFVNSTSLLAFIWGPMKFILQTACTFSEAFDTLIDAYQRIGELIPLLSQFETLFRSQPQMSRVLTLMYEDILSFHWKTLGYFKKPNHQVWRQLFSALWKSFSAEYGAILRNLREHRELIETQANLAQFAELIRNQELAKITLETIKEDENQRRREVVQQWLSAARCEADQETYSKVRQECPGSGHWLLKLDRFHSWFHPDFCSTPLLWLCGIPGAGKTILASLVIEQARNLNGVSVAFFYCRYQDPDRNTFLALARGILSQLLRQDETLLPYLYEKASRSGQTILSTVELAKELLQTALKNFPKLYIVIDGIDECDREERKDIASMFESTWESLPIDDTDSMRCLFVSQDDGAARKHFAKMVSLRVTVQETSQDIRTYASCWSSKIQLKFDLSVEQQKFIEDMITAKADGMFLFAKLISSYLYEQSSLRKLDEELLPGNFPQGPLRLDDLYSKIIHRVFGDGGAKQTNEAVRLVSWLVCAKRPLKWHEIQCAVSVDIEGQTVNWDRNRFRVDSKDLCGSLVEVHTDDTVNLVHHTAKRYLVDKAIVNTVTEELDLALLCLGYLSFPDFDSNMEHSDICFSLSLGRYGFFDYAYAYWARHLERSVVMEHPEDRLSELAEAVGVFIEMHWTEPRSRVPVPKSTFDRLKILKDAKDFRKIASAVHIARKQLNAFGNTSIDEQVLLLGQLLDKFRDALEESSSTVIDQGRFQQMYGRHIFKCPRLNCTRFYNGFARKQLRDGHVPKHERSYFCSFPSCHLATLGCTTAKELQKHENEAHGTFEFDEDNEFPEVPVEKVTFDCNQCDAKFTRKHNLNIHMRTHNAPNEKRFVCITCGKGFARQGDRTKHQSTFHSEPKTFSCGGTLRSGAPWGCGREFNRADILARHYKSDKGRTCRLLLEEEEASETGASTPTISQTE